MQLILLSDCNRMFNINKYLSLLEENDTLSTSCRGIESERTMDQFVFRPLSIDRFSTGENRFPTFVVILLALLPRDCLGSC